MSKVLGADKYQSITRLQLLQRNYVTCCPLYEFKRLFENEQTLNPLIAQYIKILNAG
jgi:hypothetical protein